MFRDRIRTTQEKRAVYDAEEQGVRVRGKRSKRFLPDCYDDLYNNKSFQKSWKVNRKTKYNPNRGKSRCSNCKNFVKQCIRQWGWCSKQYSGRRHVLPDMDCDFFEHRQ